MKLKIIYGTSGTGKSEYCFKKAAKNCAKDIKKQNIWCAKKTVLHMLKKLQILQTQQSLFW